MRTFCACVAQYHLAATSWHCQIAHQNIDIWSCVEPLASLFRVEGQHSFPFVTSATQVVADA
jgi:hypothetical protein